MSMGHGTHATRQSGFSLIWVIAVITIMASLSTAVLNMSTTAVKNEMMLTFDNQARFLAESGINYAANYASNILSGATNTPLTILNGRTITTGLGTGNKIELTVTTSPSNAYDYVVTSVGTVNEGEPFEAKYSVTNVINAPDSGTGVYIVQTKQGVATASPTSVSVSSSSLNDYTAGISFDPTRAGTGNQVASANFNNGVGSLLRGIRVYFTYNISAGSNADGFIFAIKNGTWNGPRDAGGPQAGVSHGSFLGYAGPGYPYWGHGLGLRPPKIGVEFDIYTNSGHSGSPTVSSDGRNDPDNHHLGNVFWGSTWSIGTNATVAPTNSYSTSSYYGYDDNVHNFGGANDKTDYRPFNPDGSDNDPGGSGRPGLLSITRTNMVGTASPVPVRVEVIRPTAVVSTNSTSAYYNMYAYVIKTWQNCTGAGCNDIGTDYTGTSPTMQYTLYLTAAEHTMFQFFVFGYQVSTGAQTGQYTFSIPKIGMR
ncbi:hypothetical protein [Fundidesulfovibrio soli]|uniref:hypothetical protein n=1 Tax=Fundidesulfovibrio soli TaxID=2922716 RepID=UPI001FAF5919|nr:hypothetical protein [Fundidesulfovibrio soli]